MLMDERTRNKYGKEDNLRKDDWGNYDNLFMIAYSSSDWFLTKKKARHLPIALHVYSLKKYVHQSLVTAKSFYCFL